MPSGVAKSSLATGFLTPCRRRTSQPQRIEIFNKTRMAKNLRRTEQIVERSPDPTLSRGRTHLRGGRGGGSGVAHPNNMQHPAPEGSPREVMLSKTASNVLNKRGF